MSFLQKNVLSIVNSLKTLPCGLVELFVSDNASDDGTDVFMSQLERQYDFIRYHRHSENQGANANFYTALKMAHGEYAWLLGDDDQIVEESVTQVLADLDRYKPSVVIGGTVHDVTGRRVYLPKIKTHVLTNRTILSEYDAIQLAGKMSVLIFSTEALSRVLEPGWALIQKTKTPWPHLVWFLKLLGSDDHSCLDTRRPAARPRDPEISRNAPENGNLIDPIGSREQVAGRRNLNYQQNLLILPYATNYIIEKNRYNTLQHGVLRLDLCFTDYAHLVKSLLDEFDQGTQYELIRHITAGRIGELAKILAYSTYLNRYTETLSGAKTTFKALPSVRNKVTFGLSYALPALLPIPFRQWLFHLPRIIRPSWEGYHDFIRYLETVCQLKGTANRRHFFDKGGL